MMRRSNRGVPVEEVRETSPYLSQVVLYLPELITDATIEHFSPSLWNVISKRVSGALQNHAVLWDGSIAGIYHRQPGFVFVSQHFRNDLRNLAEACSAEGHVAFYDDLLLLPSGRFKAGALQEAAEALLGPAVAS